MNTSSNENDELHDQLIDLALREAVGEESPPDLSQRILAAAAGEKQPATLPTRRTQLVLSGPSQLLANRKVQISLVAAASLLLLASLTALRPLHSAKEEPRGELAQVASVEPQPVDEVSELGDLTEEAGQDASGPTAGSKLVMGVTPRVILQEQPSDGEVLGVKVHPTPGLVAPNTPKPTSARVLTQQAARWHYYSNSQTQPSEREVFSFGMGFGRGAKRTAGRYGGGFGGRVTQQPKTLDPLQVAASEFGDGRSSNVKTLHRDLDRELNKKLELYNKKAEEIDGQESAANLPSELSRLIHEVRETQRDILQEKQELSELEIARKVAEQQTSYPASIERHVKEQLAKDPQLAAYRSEEFAIVQELRQLKSASKDSQASQIKRLETTLRDLQIEAHAYQRKVEMPLRKAVSEEFIASEQAEQDQQEKALKARIAVLEQDYKKKVDEIESRGNRNSELALLESEIEQLREVEHELKFKLQQLGQGPGESGDKYNRIYENPFLEVEGERAVSTFSIDVDTASYANVRQFLLQSSQLPPPDAVRIEELVNYFPYDYSPPTDETPFAAHVEVAGCPWNAEHRLVRVGLKGREVAKQTRPQSNLVFLIDVSGSMDEASKLPLLIEGMKLLTRELGENDRVAIVVYASSEGLALPSTRGDQQNTILAALEKLRAGGSTAGGAGIQLAYQIAKDNFIQGGVNRVILATDGDFNVGVTSPAELETMAETKAKETGVFLTVLGFGRGNLNDAMMEQISGKGNGNYHYIDNLTEARKVLVEEMSGTLVTIAKDVKIQIEFNPAQASAYRLIGYENRMLKTQDFNDDKKDAGEIGAGHTVTAIYEVVPAGKEVDVPAVDALKYQAAAKTPSDADDSDELLTLKLRYKQPDGDVSTKVEFPVTDEGNSFAEASADFKFASSVASFGMLLRDSQYRGTTSYAAVKEIAQSALGKDELGYRGEFVELVQQAKELVGE